ncbi:hypothetical protein [Nocardia caishijiensis]|uniref:Two-component sensor histidine kinase n=1 Tax=Nocardia caishijiensis TaxID=184756 RepID=A0ABQ6YGA9_9NOCA|nr:hypothetical protein [Nocardia caishijiensis]KAF0842522.1 hypothetical protein FNL39_111103 [Nocardia caishijiensis]
MLTFLILLSVITALAVLVGRGSAGATGVIDRDAQRIDAELRAIAGYATDMRPGHF